MGIKRLSRRRMAAIEARGIKKGIGCSPAMGGTIISATQHREGLKVTTDILYDLGASGTSILTKGLAAADPIGISGTDVSYICKLTAAVFGSITTIETVCLEVITDGTLTDYDLMYGDADGYLGSDASNDSLLANEASEDIGSAVGVHRISTFDAAADIADKYLYITAGAATSQKASAVIDCTNATPSNIADGIDTIRLIDSGGAAVLFVAESDTTYSAGAQTNKFNIGSMTTTAHLATSLKLAIDNNGAFDAVVTDTTKVTVTHAASTATSNHQAGYLLNDDPQASNGISIGEFTGGIDDGTAITGGKLLIRVTGFMPMADK